QSVRIASSGPLVDPGLRDARTTLVIPGRAPSPCDRWLTSRRTRGSTHVVTRSQRAVKHARPLAVLPCHGRCPGLVLFLPPNHPPMNPHNASKQTLWIVIAACLIASLPRLAFPQAAGQSTTSATAVPPLGG